MSDTQHGPHDLAEQRLREAFSRYCRATEAHRGEHSAVPAPDVVDARLDVTLLLVATGGEIAPELELQSLEDGQSLLRRTPPL